MASKLIIYGGQPLHGQVDISGAKNAALPILAASLLTQGQVCLGNVPHLVDITVMLQLLSDLGVEVALNDQNQVILKAAIIRKNTVSYALVKAMRASIVVLGPLLSRFGHARVALPGGCAIGARPIDVHLSGLKAMGAKVELEEGYVTATVSPGRLKGAKIKMPVVSVTGTENLMMAACLASGTTIIENAAREPEVYDLGEMLIKMGALIKGHGTSKITIEGVSELGECQHSILPDRIEAGTYLIAGALIGKKLLINNIETQFIKNEIKILKKMGVKLNVNKNFIEIFK